MNVPVQITSRHVTLSEKQIELIHCRVQSLTRLHTGISRCHIVVDDPHKRRRRGRRFRVKVSVAIPDDVIVSDRGSGAEREDDNLDVALTPAFRAMRRQLAESSERRTRCRTRTSSRPWQKKREGREELTLGWWLAAEPAAQ